MRERMPRFPPRPAAGIPVAELHLPLKVPVNAAVLRTGRAEMPKASRGSQGRASPRLPAGAGVCGCALGCAFLGLHSPPFHRLWVPQDLVVNEQEMGVS